MNQEPQAPLWPEKDSKTTSPRTMDAGAAPQPLKFASESALDAERSANSGLRSTVPGTFGEKLQRERELRSITLEEIAASTKIGTRLLHALETEEFEKLPGGIFNKGFVRAYAKYLGLDEDQAVTDYVAAENEKDRKRRAPVGLEPAKQGQPQLVAIQGGARPDNVYNIRATTEVNQPQPDVAGGFLKAAVILVFVLGIGGFGWKYYQSHAAPIAAKVPSEAPRVKPSATIQPPQPQASNVLPDAPSTVAASAKISEATSQSKAAASKPNPPADSPSSESTSPTKESGNKTATAPAEFTLDLRAEEDSWAQITADGKTLWSGIVSRDGSKSFHATKELVVKLGNAPGVQLSYNGKLLPRFSQDDPGSNGSRTRTLTFTPDGLASH